MFVYGACLCHKIKLVLSPPYFGRQWSASRRNMLYIFQTYIDNYCVILDLSFCSRFIMLIIGTILLAIRVAWFFTFSFCFFPLIRTGRGACPRTSRIPDPPRTCRPNSGWYQNHCTFIDFFFFHSFLLRYSVNDIRKLTRVLF